MHSEPALLSQLPGAPGLEWATLAVALLALAAAVAAWLVAQQAQRRLAAQTHSALEQQAAAAGLAQTQQEQNGRLEQLCLAAEGDRELQQRFAAAMLDKWRQFEAANTPSLESLLDWVAQVRDPALCQPTAPQPPAPGTAAPASHSFIAGPPILCAADFFGRQELMVDFFARVFGSQLCCFSLVGARRSGKTSFLYHVRDEHVRRSHLGDRHAHVVIIFLDLLNGVTTPDQFYAYLVRETMCAVARVDGEAPRPFTYLDGLPSRAVSEFLAALAARGWHFVVMLDEFEHLVGERRFEHDFFEHLRYLANTGSVAWVTATYRSLPQLIPVAPGELTSPFTNIFNGSCFTGPLDEQDARELLQVTSSRAGYPVSDEDVAFVLALGGRMPYALQVAGDILANLKRDRSAAEPERYALAGDHFAAWMLAHYEQHWRHLEPADRAALRAAAAGTPPAATEHLRRMRRLEDYGYVERVDGAWRPLGSAFAAWLRELPADRSGGSNGHDQPRYDISLLQDALTHTFTRAELRQFVYLTLHVDLDTQIAEGSLRDEAFDLIRWAERQHRVDDLLAAAREHAPKESDLARYARSLA